MAETANLTDLDAAIDRRIVAMLSAVVEESRTRSTGDPAINRYQLESVAKAMTPRVKKAEAQRCNPLMRPHERRFTAGAEFEHKNGHRWRLVVTDNGSDAFLFAINTTTWQEQSDQRQTSLDSRGYTLEEIFGVDHDFVPVG